MDPKLLKQVVNQIHRRYPEFNGCQPKVRRQTPPQAQATSDSPRYLLTFSGKATAMSASGAKSIPRYLRVVVDSTGKIIKVTTSR
jgi:hypothetical protein